MIYITGDKHGDFDFLDYFCEKYNTTIDDILIILGDAGINYYLNELDYKLKNKISKYPITLFCIHGNHEERPENINTYITKEFNGGLVYYEKEYPNILFSIDGEIYNFNGNKTISIGGAYSVDKQYRLEVGLKWYQSEQPSEEIKNRVRESLKENNNEIDVILTHTCPYKYVPTEMFLPWINQSKVDNSTEYFLDEIEENNKYNKWYCGHYHTDKTVDKIRFMRYDIDEFEKEKVKRKNC